MNPDRISQFLDRIAFKPKWQIAFRSFSDSLRLLHLRLYNRDARTVELMELQLNYRVELLLEEERICLEQHEKGVVVSKDVRVPKNLFDMSLDEIISDVEWEPTMMERPPAPRLFNSFYIYISIIKDYLTEVWNKSPVV